MAKKQAESSKETPAREAKSTAPQLGHVVDLKPGKYSDGHPLDEVQYLECKLILKPDRFTSAKVFQEYGALVGRAAKEFGIGFSTKGVALKPEIREVLFLDTADFRLYNNAFILRRRIAYENGFPVGDRRWSSSSGTRTCRRPRSSTCGRISRATTGSSSRPRLCR